jgi:hypothetical protein
MIKSILHGLLYLAKAYLMLVGLIVTLMVARQLYVDHQGTPPLVRAQLNLVLPPATFTNQIKPNVGRESEAHPAFEGEHQ